MGKGAAVAYATAGGLLVFSGFKGSSISGTVRGALGGNLGTVQGSETIGIPATTGDGGTNPVNVAISGSGNYLTIAHFLNQNGYSPQAAAGIAGCVAGESSGNPEAKGDGGTSFGIIQEHGSQYSGLVTGHPGADLSSQLSALIEYNNAQGSQMVSMLNAIPDPVQAAYFYSEHFERPAVKDSDVVTSVAQSVYQSLIQGK